MSLLLRGATILRSLDPPEVVSADLVIKGERIAWLGHAGTPANAPSVSDGEPMGILDCSGTLVAPGNVCAHTHAYAALAEGMPNRLPAAHSFLEILQRLWWRLDRALDPSTITASALVAGRAALLAGTTTMLDHHASPNAIDGSLDLLADAFQRLGLRSVLAYEVTDRDGPERAGAGIRENERFLGGVAHGDRPLARGLVGGHASFTLSADTLERCVALARAARSGIHLHVAEGAVDEEDALARFGERVVSRLDRAGALDGGLLAHAVHLDRSEADTLRDRASTIVHNPRSNMHNGVGRAPLAFLGERVALGTDGIGADMFEEARAAYLRRREEEPATAPAWALARLAHGAALAGRIFGEPRLGRLEAGAPADVVVLEAGTPTPLDAGNLAAHWVYALGTAAVRDVIVGGRVVVRDRRLTMVDEAELLADARVQAARLWGRVDEIGPHPFRPDAERRAVATSARGAV